MATAEHYPYERGLAEFNRVVAAAQREIMLHVTNAIETGNLTRRRARLLQLAKVIAVLDQVGARVDPAARRMAADAYTQGADRALTQIHGLDIAAPEIPGAFTGVSVDAIRALQDQVVNGLKDSRAKIGRQVDDVYGRAGRAAATRSILGAHGSPQAARRGLVETLMKDKQISRVVRGGGPGFVDAAGRKWTLDRYADMAVRTVTREAVVQGSINRMVSHGINLARVSFHATSCPVCKPFEGRLVSLDGEVSEYQGEAVMDTGEVPPYHPNCAHSLQPVAVDIESLKREMTGA